MAWQVAWTRGALHDLDEIGSYIGRDSEARASRYVQRILAASWSLDEMAERCRMVPEFEDPVLRELIVGKHRVLFRMQEKVVYILAVVHGARDFLQLWEDELRFR